MTFVNQINSEESNSDLVREEDLDNNLESFSVNANPSVKEAETSKESYKVDQKNQLKL